MATALKNFWDIPLEELRSLQPSAQVQLDADETATVIEHLHRSGQLRVSLDAVPDRVLVVTYDAVERILP